MKILVTGANGYIGQHVVTKILDAKHDVIAVDLHNNNIDSRAKYVNMNIFSGDMDMFDKLDRPDICLHLAWQDGFIHNSDKHIKMLYSHFEFLKNLANSGIKKIAVMGSMHEIGYHEGVVNENTPCNPISMYGIAKNSLRQMLFSMFDGTSVKLQWLRAFYIVGDDDRNNSIFTKIKIAEHEGNLLFPFTTGEKKYDFINIDDLAVQITAAILQDEVLGIINCCSGKPVPLKDKVEQFLNDNHYNIKLQYGAYPDRKYDSPAIWGDCTKIDRIMRVVWYKKS